MFYTADASPLSASVIIILRRTNSGSFTDRQRKRVRERDCRRRAQIKTPPNPIRDGNCVRSSGPAIGRLLGVDGWKRGRGGGGERLAGRLHPRNARGDSEFIPGKGARAFSFARLSAYLNQPRVSQPASIEHANPLPLCARSLRKRITSVRCQRKSLSGKERQRMRRKRLQRLMIITVGFDHLWFLYS